MAQLHRPDSFFFVPYWLAGPSIVACAYFLGAELAFLVGTFSDRFFAPFWPPNAVLFGALAFVPYAQWWIYIAAVLPVHVLVEWQVAMPPPQIAVAFGTNCAVAILNAIAVKHLLSGPLWLDSFNRAFLYILATCTSAAVVAFGGAFVRLSAEGHWDAYWLYWMQWYVSNALGSLTLGPILLVLLNGEVERCHWPSWREVLEPLLLAAALVAACALAFKVGAAASFAGFLPVLLYLPLPLVVWSTVRFGIKGASGAVLIVTIASIGMTLNAPSVFGAADADSKVLALQLFLTGFAVPVLLLGASVEGMREVAQTTRRLAHNLIQSHDDERRSTAKALHEEVCQDLAGASLVTTRLAPLVPHELRAHVERIEQALQKATRDLRSASYVLHPALLDESGLELALRSLVERLFLEGSVAVDLSVSADLGRLPPEVEIAVFRFVQSALNDICGRQSEVSVRITRHDASILITVDGGQAKWGRSLWSRKGPALDSRQTMGLAEMRARLSRVGGKVELEPAQETTALRAIIRIPSSGLWLDNLVADRVTHQSGR